MLHFIESEIRKTHTTIERVLADRTLLQTTETIARLCVRSLQNKNKILLAGNGGSAADSQHLAAELVSRLRYNRPGLPAIALTTDTSALTAIGNDYHFEHLFSRQLEAIGQPGDIFIGISTSGNSKNILNALTVARKMKLTTIGFSGGTGGTMGAHCDYLLKAPSTETPKIQECHIMLGHIIFALIEEEIFGAEYNPERFSHSLLQGEQS